MSFTKYQAFWNDEEIPLKDLFNRLKSRNYPESLEIFHPQIGTTRINDTGHGGMYTVSRWGPPLNGMRGGIARTSAMNVIDQQQILPVIDAYFPKLQELVESHSIGQQKLLRAQLNAAKKIANKAEIQLGENVPDEVRSTIAQMIGEKKPATGSNTVPKNFAKINTNLFQNNTAKNNLRKINTTLFQGGKKKRKSTRESTRKRRV